MNVILTHIFLSVKVIMCQKLANIGIKSDENSFYCDDEEIVTMNEVV
jgi:hypothetical protein